MDKTSMEEQHTAPKKGRIHLIVGPVGAGKSTLALELAQRHRAVRLTLDEWMTRLFRPDRPDAGVLAWYRERAERCIEQIWRLSQQLVESGADVVLEIGLLTRRERALFYRRVEAAGAALTVYAVDAPRDVRRERVEQRNRARGATFSMEVPPEIFELASDLWEPLDATECGGDVRWVQS